MSHRRVVYFGLVLAAGLVCTGLTAYGAASPKSVAQRLQLAARMAESRSRLGDAATACEDVLAEPNLPADEKAAAFDLLIDVLRRQGRFDDAVKAADRLREAFPADMAAEAKAFLLKADIYRQAKKDDESLKVIQEFLRVQPDNKAGAAEAHLKAAEFHLRAKRYVECEEEAAKAIDLDPQGDPRVSDALALVAEAAWKAEDMEKFAATLPRLLEPRYLSRRDAAQQRDLRDRYGQCLKRLKRFDEALAHFVASEKADADPRQAAEWCLRAADTLAEQEKLDEALAAAERVFTAHPQSMDQWWGAQQRIVQWLVRKGRHEEAIRAARILLDAAADERALADTVRLIADVFRAIDKNLGRANALINYQRFGPDGEDQKPGTDDDLKDPLEALARPAYPDREKAFAEVRKQAGDNARAMRFFAFTYLYAGRPKEALRCFMDAFGRAQVDEIQSAGLEMVVIGARAARGHPAGLDAFFHFVNYGPAGPDGKLKTADDLADPFAPLLK